MKTYLISLCFAKPEVLRAGIERSRSLMSGDVEHYFQDQHYPLYVDKIRQTMAGLAERYPNTHLIDSGGPVGLLRGLNYFFNHIKDKLQPDDVVIQLDPDSWIETQGWDVAITDVLADPQIAWASLMNPCSRTELPQRGYDPINVRGIRCWRTKAPCVNNVSGFRGDFLLKVGGFHAHMDHYGHMETATWSHILAQKKSWVYLPDYVETDVGRPAHDQAYIDWKWAFAHTAKWKGDFESYLAAGCPK